MIYWKDKRNIVLPPLSLKSSRKSRDLKGKTMDNKLMYIPNEDKINYPFCRLNYYDINIFEQTNHNLTKVPKIELDNGIQNFGYQCNQQTNVSIPSNLG